MKKIFLINNTCQVIDDNDDVLFQGDSYECDQYIDTSVFLDELRKNPEWIKKLKEKINKIIIGI
jgi:hypothetical protein